MSQEISRSEMIKLIDAGNNNWREYSAPRDKSSYFVNEILKLMIDNDIHDVKYMCMHAKYKYKSSWMFLFPETVDLGIWDIIIRKRFPEMNMHEADYIDVLNSNVQIKCAKG